MVNLNKRNEVNSIYNKENILLENIEHGIMKKIQTKVNSLIYVIGKSGVGKTTLINYLTKSDLPISYISKKHKKGKHTTTLSIGKVIDNMIIFDTPGFEKVSITHLVKKDISKLFFNQITLEKFKCKYTTCTHLNEKNCLLRNLVKNREISFLRFKIYKELFNQANTTHW